ncbi:hypothetical protein [Synechococcus sp. CBW1006]|uniref:hypothetical protein n=1 Tax=Synechococcus sp. CBW1006 TaxID=1353138 RepID=UPI0018CCB30D|nr:hypothetical protein [Synechococcus sp. CBW1006]QPN68096.1 hypothetical protein H8F26_08465 [Synechococcus sp. CBW1006]
MTNTIQARRRSLALGVLLVIMTATTSPAHAVQKQRSVFSGLASSVCTAVMWAMGQSPDTAYTWCQ